MFLILHDICCCVLHIRTSIMCVFYVFWLYLFTARLQILWNVDSLLKNETNFFLIKPTDALISQIYFVKKSTCFGQLLCPSSGVFHSTFGTGICHQTCMIYTTAECTVGNSWWWTEELPETCRFFCQNKFGKLVRLLVLLKINFLLCTLTCHVARSHVTMHAHMSRCTLTCHDARSHERKMWHLFYSWYIYLRFFTSLFIYIFINLFIFHWQIQYIRKQRANSIHSFSILCYMFRPYVLTVFM
jgi:hypothetical protein